VAVDFLDIAPKEVRKETVTVKDQEGQDREVEIYPIDASDLAKLARRFPSLRAIFAKGAPEDLQAMALAEHWPAIIAASLGHLGEEPYELAAKRYQPDQRDRLGKAIMALSFPKAAEEEPGPLAPSAEAVIAEAVAGVPAADSPLPSSA
jgi:hypothetical protein